MEHLSGRSCISSLHVPLMSSWIHWLGGRFGIPNRAPCLCSPIFYGERGFFREGVETGGQIKEGCNERRQPGWRMWFITDTSWKNGSLEQHRPVHFSHTNSYSPPAGAAFFSPVRTSSFYKRAFQRVTCGLWLIGKPKSAAAHASNLCVAYCWEGISLKKKNRILSLKIYFEPDI